MTKKQITAIHNLIKFIDKGNDTVPLSESWYKKFHYIKKYRCSLIKLSPSCQETQKVITFLIKSMKRIRKYNTWLEHEVM